MGIKDLWSILTPFCETKPLFELQGKTVAVDLSCWVCEAQNVTEYAIQPRMYLRNLYFRTCCLLLMDVTPVFVLEGKAPELKYKTIAARNAVQFKGAAEKKPGVKTGKDRSRFNHTLKQCEEMLNIMGIACVKGNGEAEALCAHLNADNLIDGIISQDSDCFAYGAKVVYRNFSISQQGHHAAKGGSVDIYDISKAYQSLNFGRNKIIALALLCGSDYCDGVHGVGKDSVLKLFNIVSDDDILNRLRRWRDQTSLYEEFEAKISDKNVCTSCGHFGKLQRHTRLGCPDCKTTKGCDFTKFKDERLDIKNELNMRNRALADSGFPNEELIGEFLNRDTNVAGLNLKWRKPNLIKFIEFTVKFLMWEEVYAFVKILPILTRWQLLHYRQLEKNCGGIVFPKCIKKRRNPKGIASYEIIWEDRNGEFTDLLPQDQIVEFGDVDKLWSTIEPRYLVEKAHPALLVAFEESKKPKGKRKKKQPLKDLNELMGNISISEPVVKKTKKVNTLDNFVVKNPTTETERVAIKQISEQSNTKLTAENQSIFDLDQSNFGDENDLDISHIVEDIVQKTPPAITLDSLKDFHFINDCSFFISEPKESDLFEKTFNEFCCNSDNSNEYDSDVAI